VIFSEEGCFGHLMAMAVSEFSFIRLVGLRGCLLWFETSSSNCLKKMLVDSCFGAMAPRGCTSCVLEDQRGMISLQRRSLGCCLDYDILANLLYK